MRYSSYFLIKTQRSEGVLLAARKRANAQTSRYLIKLPPLTAGLPHGDLSALHESLRRGFPAEHVSLFLSQLRRLILQGKLELERPKGVRDQNDATERQPQQFKARLDARVT